MNFLSPITALIAAGIVIPALVALYFLKLRRRQVEVSSTLLWRKAIQDMQVNAPFQRLRKNLLLLLQLLLLAALLLAMARPTTQSVAAPGQRVVIVIDHSASMNAPAEGASGPTRLERAQQAALDLIDSLGAEAAEGGVSGAGGAMVVAFAQQARVMQPFTGDLGQLRNAVRQIQPTDQVGQLAPALGLIEPFAAQAVGAAGETAANLMVYVLSDGRVDRSASEGLALPGAELQYVRMGDAASSENVGIVSFAARRDFDRPQIVQVFARVTNFGSQAVTTLVTLRVDGRDVRSQRISVPGRSDAGPRSVPVSFEAVLPGAAMIEVRHDHADALAADDVARLHLAPARRIRVLLVSRGNTFLERVIRSAGVRELVLMTPEKYATQDPEALRRGGWDAAGTTAAAEAGFDLIVFDGHSPAALPPVSSLSFGAAPPVEGLELRPPREQEEGQARSEPILDWRRDHPLLRYVALDDVIVREPARVVVPAEGLVLATAQPGPVMAEVAAGRNRHVVVSFPLVESNWPLYISFPVFVSNAVQTLGLGGMGSDEAGLAYRTGEVAMVPASGGGMRYDGPDVLEARAAGGGGSDAVLPAFTRVGVYTARGSVEPPFDRVPVNLLSETESDLLPAERLDVGTRVVQGQGESQAVRREVWHWFVWGALGLLMIEWLVYTRRMHL